MAEKLITAHHLLCDNVHYGPGEEFASDDAALIAQLRRDGTLKTEAEFRPAEAISEKDREIKALRLELEQMKAQMGIPLTLGEGNPELESPKSDE